MQDKEDVFEAQLDALKEEVASISRRLATGSNGNLTTTTPVQSAASTEHNSVSLPPLTLPGRRRRDHEKKMEKESNSRRPLEEQVALPVLDKPPADAGALRTWMLAGASPANQVSRAQVALQELASERDTALVRLGAAQREVQRLRHVETEVQTLRVALNSSERIRRQQKSLLDQHKINHGSSSSPLPLEQQQGEEEQMPSPRPAAVTTTTTTESGKKKKVHVAATGTTTAPVKKPYKDKGTALVEPSPPSRPTSTSTTTSSTTNGSVLSDADSVNTFFLHYSLKHPHRPSPPAPQGAISTSKAAALAAANRRRCLSSSGEGEKKSVPTTNNNNASITTGRRSSSRFSHAELEEEEKKYPSPESKFFLSGGSGTTLTSSSTSHHLRGGAAPQGPPPTEEELRWRKYPAPSPARIRSTVSSTSSSSSSKRLDKDKDKKEKKKKGKEKEAAKLPLEPPKGLTLTGQLGSLSPPLTTSPAHVGGGRTSSSKTITGRLR